MIAHAKVISRKPIPVVELTSGPHAGQRFMATQQPKGEAGPVIYTVGYDWCFLTDKKPCDHCGGAGSVAIPHSKPFECYACLGTGDAGCAF